MSEHVLWTDFPKIDSEYRYCSVCCLGFIPYPKKECSGKPTPGNMNLERMIKEYGQPIPLNHTGNNQVATFVVTPLF